MKENSNGKELVLDVGENTSKEFNDKLSIIKHKVIKFRGLENESVKLQLEVRDLTDKFVEQFKDNKQELGKIVS